MTAGTDSSAADGPGEKGDDETRAFITQTYQRAEAFLFGRRTYELFADARGMRRPEVPDHRTTLS